MTTSSINFYEIDLTCTAENECFDLSNSNLKIELYNLNAGGFEITSNSGSGFNLNSSVINFYKTKLTKYYTPPKMFVLEITLIKN